MQGNCRVQRDATTPGGTSENLYRKRELKRAEGWVSCSTHILEKSQPSKPHGALWLSTSLWAGPSNCLSRPLGCFKHRANRRHWQHKSFLKLSTKPHHFFKFLLGSWQQPPKMDIRGRAHPNTSMHSTASSTQARQTHKNQNVPTGRFHPDLPAKLLGLFHDGFIFNSARRILSNKLKTKGVY